MALVGNTIITIIIIIIISEPEALNRWWSCGRVVWPGGRVAVSGGRVAVWPCGRVDCHYNRQTEASICLTKEVVYVMRFR